MKISTTSLATLALAGSILATACKPAPTPAPAPATPSPTPASEASTAAPDQAAATPAPTPAGTPIALPQIVATVNGQNITREELEKVFNAAVQASGAQVSDLSPDQQLAGYSQLLQDLILDKLVDEAASKEQVTDADVDAEIAKIKSQFPESAAFDAQLTQAGMTQEKLRENIRDGLMQSRWMQSQVKPAEITEEKARAFYDANPKEFEQPETVKASHILFMVDAEATPEVAAQKEDAAKKAAERAAKGEDFTALAKELSEEPGASESGGDLGFFPKDRMVPEFAEAAFAQEVGTISQPVKTQFGWHVIKVTDKKPAGKVPFDEVEDQIEGYLKSQSQREAVQAVLNKLKESAKIETFLPQAS
jgi:peptidyl-prolyl cis-trans isomerase C